MEQKITIITPSFNQAQFLEHTIDSILSQNYLYLEYIIIDGGSTDGSTDIIKKHEKYLKYWISELDKGQSHAINKGLKHASGDIINWINSDDYLAPGALKIISDAFGDPNAYVLCGRSNIVQNNKIVRQTRGTDVYPDNLSKTIGQARIDQPETWFRKKIFDKITPVKEDLHFIMDKYLWVQYLMLYGLDHIIPIEDILVNFRHHDQSKTVSQDQEFLEETLKMYATLARQTSDLKIEAFISSLLKRNEDNNDEFQLGVNDEVMVSSLHYFLLWLADYFYVNKEYSKAAETLGYVGKSVLQPHDRFRYNKLKWSIPLKLNRFRS